MIWEILASALVIWGGVMAVIGSLGLLRLLFTLCFLTFTHFSFLK